MSNLKLIVNTDKSGNIFDPNIIPELKDMLNIFTKDCFVLMDYNTFCKTGRYDGALNIVISKNNNGAEGCLVFQTAAQAYKYIKNYKDVTKLKHKNVYAYAIGPICDKFQKYASEAILNIFNDIDSESNKLCSEKFILNKSWIKEDECGDDFYVTQTYTKGDLNEEAY